MAINSRLYLKQGEKMINNVVYVKGVKEEVKMISMGTLNAYMS